MRESDESAVSAANVENPGRRQFVFQEGCEPARATLGEISAGSLVDSGIAHFSLVLEPVTSAVIIEIVLDPRLFISWRAFLSHQSHTLSAKQETASKLF